MTSEVDPTPTPSEPNVVLATFLARFVADEEAGGARPVDDYQAMFPGFEDVIAREYTELIAGSEPRTARPENAGPEQIGPYRLLRELGRGGQSVVYLAEDPRLQRKVALKVLPATLLASDRAKERFRREAELAAKLDHPGICVVLEHGQHDGMPYIAMRLVEGESLAEHIATAQARSDESEELTYLDLSTSPDTDESDEQQRPGDRSAPGRREVMRIARLLEQTARALHSAHEQGLLHRDVKPGNIMVTPQGDPVILDFGLARDEFRDGKSITLSGDLMGTPAYMSPEQLLAQRIRLDRRSDVYSLGVTAYECLTLTRPFDAPTREAMYQRILTGEVPDPRRLNPAIPRDLRVILEKAMDKDRERRYPTALAFAEDLRRLAAFEPITARPVGPGLRLRRWGRRHPALATAVALVFLSLAGGLLITWKFMSEAEERVGQLNVAVGNEAQARSELEVALGERERALRRSEALWLVELARQEQDIDPERSVAMAAAAAQRSPGPLTRGALASSLKNLPRRGRDLGRGAPFAAFTADGGSLVTKGGDEFRRYDVEDRSIAASGKADGLNPMYVATDPQGARLALLGEHRMQVFDTESGDVTAVLNAGDFTLHRAAFSGDGRLLAVAGGVSTNERQAGRVWLLDLTSGEQRVLHDIDQDCWSVDFDPDGRRIAIGCRRGELRILDLEGEALFSKSLRGTLAWPTVVFSSDGSRLFELVRNGFREWTIATGESREIPMDPKRTLFLNGVTYDRSADRRFMIVWAQAWHSLSGHMTANLPAWLWDLEKGAVVRQFPGKISSAAISADGRWIATIAGDELTMHDTAAEHPAPASQFGRFPDADWVSLDASGRRVAVVTSGELQILDTAEPDAVPRLPATVYDFALTADGESFMVHDQQRGISMLNARTLMTERSLPLGEEPPGTMMSSGATHFDMNPDGTRAVGKIGLHQIGWFDLEKGELLATLDGDGTETCLLTGGGATMLKTHGQLPEKVVDTLLLDLVKSALLGNSEIKPEIFKALIDESAVELVELKTGKTMAVIPWSSVGEPIRSRDGMKIFIPKREDGERVAVVIHGGSGKLLFEVNKPTISAEFSPDGSRILLMASRLRKGMSVSIGDHPPELADAATGSEQGTLETGGAIARDARWSPDGKYIALACDDGQVRLYDTGSRALVGTFTGHQGPVRSVEFSPDGSSLASTGKDGTLRVWRVRERREVLRLHAEAEPGERGVWQDVRFAAGGAVILAFDHRHRPFAFPMDPMARAADIGISPVSEEALKRLGM